MYGRSVSCTSSGAVGRTNPSVGIRISRTSLLLWSCAAASLVLSAQAFAQSTTLPQVTVEGNGTTAKKGTAKGAPKAAPQQPAEPVQEPETLASKEKAQKDAVYNTPAAVSTATRSDIETFGQLDTGDVLRSMPGTSTTENPQNAGLAVNIRGFEGSGRVNMMIDGVRQNFRFTAHEAKGFAYRRSGVAGRRGHHARRGIDGGWRGCAGRRGKPAYAGRGRHRQAGQHDRRHELAQLRHQRGRLERDAGGRRQGRRHRMAGAISHHEPNNYKNGDGVTVPYTLAGSGLRLDQDGHPAVGRAEPEARCRHL